MKHNNSHHYGNSTASQYQCVVFRWEGILACSTSVWVGVCVWVGGWMCRWVDVHGYGWVVVVGVCVRCEYECMWHMFVVCECVGLGGENRG